MIFNFPLLHEPGDRVTRLSKCRSCLGVQQGKILEKWSLVVTLSKGKFR